MVRLIPRQCGGLAALKLTKLFGIDDFLAAKDSGKVLIIIIYCYLIIIIIIIIITIFLDLLGLNINWDIVLFSSPKKFIEKKNSNFGHAVSYLGLPCVFFEKL